MCQNPQLAYESGYNQGMQRRPLDTQWVNSYCVPETQASVRDNYMRGYQLGTQNAPDVVEVRGAGTVAGGSSAEQCRFASDCLDGQSCRAWRGGQACMGYGSRGEPCWFSSDCNSGQCNISAKICK